MYTCESCGLLHDGSYDLSLKDPPKKKFRFCCMKCARSFATKANREEINNKVRNKLLSKRIPRVCPVCGLLFNKPKQTKTCSKECGKILQVRNTDWNYISETQKRRCSSLKERQRLRDIGRMGGFGTRCVTKNGINCDSIFEKTCYEYLEERNIKFIPHPHIPDTSKISDAYIPSLDLWVEFDGINREKKKKYKWFVGDYNYWLEKLKIYKDKKLNYIICTNLTDLSRIA